MPANCVGKNDVFVGRISKDLMKIVASICGLFLIILLKGAAWNSVQIAESLLN